MTKRLKVYQKNINGKYITYLSENPENPEKAIVIGNGLTKKESALNFVGSLILATNDKAITILLGDIEILEVSTDQ